MMSYSDFIIAEKYVFSKVSSTEVDFVVQIEQYAGLLRDFAEKRRYELSKEELLLFLLRVKGGVKNVCFKDT